MSTPGLSEKALLVQPADEKAVAPHLRCNSCSKPLFNAFQTPHGCHICQACVLTKLHPTEKRLCPGTTEACKDEDEIHICQASCMPDFATRRDISNLTVFCPNRDGGCREQMKWREVDSHLEKCEYEKVTCEQCQDSVLKKRLRSHLSEECRQRWVPCSLCQQSVVHSEMEKNHRNLDSATCCPRYTDYCPFCKDRARKLNRKDFAEHLKVCPDKLNECKFSHLGCDRKARKSDLEKHYKEDIDHHLTLMDSKLRQVAAPPSFAHPGALTAAPTTVSVGGSGVVDKLKRKVADTHDHFKKLQVNVANWAHTTLELEQMADKFGGIAQLRLFLKNLDEKIRQMDNSGGDLARRPGASPDGVMMDLGSSLVQQKLNEIEFRLLNLESTNYGGILVWKVSNLTQRRRDASSDNLFSQPFDCNGYRFRGRFYPNGHYTVQGHYASVYLVLVKGEFDERLAWPFKAMIEFRLVNRKNGANDVVRTEPFDTGESRPDRNDDLSVFCRFDRFVSMDQLLRDGEFVRNDELLLIVVIRPCV